MSERTAQDARTAAAGDRAALERLLGGPETAWITARVRTRIPAAGDEPLRGVIQLDAPTDAQRVAAVRLVGRPKRMGSTLRVDLAMVEKILRRGPWPAGLGDAVETLTGPVVDRGAERQREAAAWDAARDGLAPATDRFPGLADWWQAWCAAGGLKRTARAEAARFSTPLSAAVGADLVDRLAAVLEVLPASGEPLAVVARQAVGDAHGLDASRPLGRLAATVVEAAFAPDPVISHTEGSDTEKLETQLPTRDVWAAAGVAMSSLTSTVLCLGAPGADPTGDPADRSTSRAATATTLEAMREARMPVLLTLSQVVSGGVRPLPPGDLVHVCENPTVVEIVAERWAGSGAAADPPVPAGPIDTPGGSGPLGPVLVCTSGQPSTAVIDLLRRLTAEGAPCHYHGDFDWAGLRIARSLSTHIPWEPWRYRAADYRAAVHDDSRSRSLTGSPAQSPWDPELAAAMAEHGLAVEEEAVASLLAADVVAASTP